MPPLIWVRCAARRRCWPPAPAPNPPAGGPRAAVPPPPWGGGGGGGGGGARPPPPRTRPPAAPERLGAAGAGRARAGGVGHLLRGRRRQARRRRGRALPGGDRAGGRRPRPGRRCLPRRRGELPRRLVQQPVRSRIAPLCPPAGGRRHRLRLRAVTDPFVHLHVASGYSMRYGANHPADLVARAAEHGMPALALTDRDGLYGAVKFALACRSAGVRPIFGVDLAVAPALDVTVPPALATPLGGEVSGARPPRLRVATSPTRPGARRSPARGGASVDPRLPRGTFLARDGAGWRSLCRLTSATHLRGIRGEPVSSPTTAAEHANGLIALLGPDSTVGRALLSGRADHAVAHLDIWRAAFGPGRLVLEVVHHRGRGDRVQAQSMLRFAAEQGVPVVLSNAVRYVDALDAPTADVLDAARRLVPLDERHVDRRTAEGYLKSGKEMAAVAEDLVGPDRDAALRLLEGTARLAEQCAVDIREDLGIGSVRYPELDVVTTAEERGMGASAVLRARCEAGMGRRGMAPSERVRQRLDEELAVIDQLGYPSYFLTVADVVDLIKSLRVRAAARGSGAGSLVTYLLGISDVDPLRYGLLMERFLSPLRHQLPDIDIDMESARRMEVYDAVLDRFGADRVSCISMMDTYRVRHAIRDVGAALGLPPAEIDAVAKAFPHIRANQVHAALKDLPELRAR